MNKLRVIFCGFDITEDITEPLKFPVEMLTEAIDENGNNIAEQLKEQHKGKIIWVVPKDKVGDAVCQEHQEE